MKPIKFRHVGGVNLNRTFSARILGGERGFGDKLALESYSNDVAPCIKTMEGFTLIVEIK